MKFKIRSKQSEDMRFELSPRVTLIRGCRCAKNVISSLCHNITSSIEKILIFHPIHRQETVR